VLFRSKQCRLPAKWELNVVDVSAGIDWRYYPVTRRTCGLELRRGLARHLERSLERVVLMLDGKPVRDAATAEELDLFTRMEDLRVEHCQPWWMAS
jgi:predicted phosphohydrolase